MITLFILPADDASQGGSGTHADPLRIHGVEHFDRLLHDLDHGGVLSEIEAVAFGKGVYWTRGVWAKKGHCLARPMTLAAKEEAIIRLHPTALFEADGIKRPETLVLKLGVPYRNNHTLAKWRVEGLTFDGNEKAFPSDKFVVGGLNVWANACVVRKLTVRNLRGNRPSPENSHHLEAFGVLLNNHEDGDDGVDGGSLIENCVAEDDGNRNTYFSGIYAGYQDYGRGLLPTVVRDCRVEGIGTKPSQGIAYSLQGRTHVWNCTAKNLSYAVYNDVGRVVDCIVEKLTVVGLSYCALALRCSDEGERLPSKRNVRILNSTFDFALSGKDGIGLWVDDFAKTEAFIDSIEMSDVRFVWEGGSFFTHVLDAPNLGRVRIEGTWAEGALAKVTDGTPTDYVAVNRVGAIV